MNIFKINTTIDNKVSYNLNSQINTLIYLHLNRIFPIRNFFHVILEYTVVRVLYIKLIQIGFVHLKWTNSRTYKVSYTEAYCP